MLRMPRLIGCGLVMTLAACGNPAEPPLRDPHGLLLVIRGAGRTQEIYALRSDGTDPRRLTHNTLLDVMPDWSPDGRHIVFIRVQDSASGVAIPGNELWIMNADGSSQRRLVDATNSPIHPRWSPDGRQIAFDAYDPSVGMFRPHLMNADGSNVHALSSAAGNAYYVEWAPDGTKLLFLSNRAPPYGEAIYVIQTDGSGERQLTDTSACNSSVGESRWSPDGARIAYGCALGDTIYTIDSAGKNRVLVTSPGAGPVWSPDGRQIAFTSGRDGGFNIYVEDLASGTISRVTHDGVTYLAAWGGGQ